MTPAMHADLRLQHRDFVRSGYDGHNRKPQQQSMRHIKVRQVRRRWAAFMRERATFWDPRLAD